MKKYNKTIKVEVSVSSIADKLLSTISNDNPHRESLVETIIDNMLTTTVGMSQLYNSLSGYSNEINFEVGQEVSTEKTFYGYTLSLEREYIKINNCKIIAIDLTRIDKVEVEFSALNHKGETNIRTMWVNHTGLNEPIVG